MGSHMKKAIFEEQTTKAIKKWQKAAKDRKKLRKAGEDISSTGFRSGENTPSQSSSPLHLLHKYRASSTDIESVLNSPRSYQSDTELSEMEGSNHDRHESTTHDRVERNAESHNVDFTFVRP